MLEETVHLVREQMGAVELRDRYETREIGAIDLGTGWTVWKVDDDDARVGPHGCCDGVDVEGPVVWIERYERHRRADRSSDFVQRLVGGPHDDGVASPVEQRMHAEKYRFLGTGKGHH